MKKLFTSIVALSFATAGINAMAASPDASPEAKPAANPAEAPAEAPAPAVIAEPDVEVPTAIAEHIALRFPGETVEGISREGVTYVVDLGDGLHIRYDNCFNPVCYGNHSHDCSHR